MRKPVTISARTSGTASDLTGTAPSNSHVEEPARHFWRSLEERSETPDSADCTHREFPEGALQLSDPLARREFLRVMGAALAMADLAGCSRPPEFKIIPYVEQPEEIEADRPLRFATAMTLGGFATGLLVRSNEGRPTKVEGNPSHPCSRGATGPLEQAALLQLYDPDRSRTVLHGGNIEPYEAVLEAVLTEMRRQRSDGGKHFRLLTGPVTSPTLAAQIDALRTALPAMKWHQWEPLPRWSFYQGAQLAFDQTAEPEYHLGDADVIVSFDYDFLSLAPDRILLTKEFAARRRFEQKDSQDPQVLFVSEPTLSITGSMAQMRLPVAAGDIRWVMESLGARLEVWPAPASAPKGDIEHWLNAAARALLASSGRSLVVVGPAYEPEVHALAHAINLKLGNIGRTILYRQIALAQPIDPLASLRELVNDLENSAADSVLILGGNPVFTAPADFKLGEGLRHSRFSLYLGSHLDETAVSCQWHVPEQHFLESWSDARAVHGDASIVQPLIAPLYAGISVHQLMAVFLGSPAKVDYDIVRDYWRQHGKWGSDFESAWRQVLSDGVIGNTATPLVNPLPAGATPAQTPGLRPSGNRPVDEEFEVIFRPDPTLWDGQFANNAWLQELPKPFSKVTWGNPAIISPRAAQKLGLQNGQVIRIHHQTAHLEIPVWIQPGQAERTITLHLGNGRKRAGRVGNEVGVDTYAIRFSTDLWRCADARVERTERVVNLAQTHLHHSLQGRTNILRTVSFDDFKEAKLREDPELEPAPDDTLYSPGELNTAASQWGMVINLNTCIGCTACVIACQAENNIPTVGAVEVSRGREMHWIRVDHYFEGSTDNPRVFQQPVPCMHCETAPCELVCPVEATLHSSDGLNQQIYNRCVGTRYCSNNCPYKVRRFNFLQYSDTRTPSAQLVWNPQVTVRSRGVMEKCTYCVQRIRTTQIQAREEHRAIRDMEITPACAQACPADAIVFGDVANPHSKVSRLKALKLNYSMLGDLNTRPRTTYLARVEWSSKTTTSPHPGQG